MLLDQRPRVQVSAAPVSIRHRARGGELHRWLGRILASGVLPGSGLMGGRHRGAGVALMAMAALFAATTAWVVIFGRDRLIAWLVQPSSLRIICAVLAGVAVLWVTSVLTTTVATRPRRPGPLRSSVAAGVAAALVIAVVAPVGVVIRSANAQSSLVASVFGDPNDKNSGTVDYDDALAAFAGKSRVNVLLLGGDAGDDREGVRTDTMLVASIDTSTGDTTLIGLPRNLIHIPLPPGSALEAAYGPEYWGGGDEAEWMLNSMYRLVPANHPDIFANSDDPGADVLKVTIGHILDLEIDYYVLVEIEGFQAMVDALGGVNLDVSYRVPIGGNSDRGIPPTRYLEPGANQQLDGYEALWYVRGRYGIEGGDFARMDRQQCFLQAMIDQADPANVLLRYQQIAAATTDLLATDIPAPLLPALVQLGLKAKDASVETLALNPSRYGSYANPDYDAIRALTRATIEGGPQVEDGASAGTASPSTGTTAAPSPSSPSSAPSGGGSGQTATGTDRPATITDVCTYQPGLTTTP